MPIFEYEGKKYNVADEHIESFIQDFPDASTIIERDGKKYRVKSSDYNAFITDYSLDAEKPIKQSTDITPIQPSNPVEKVKQDSLNVDAGEDTDIKVQSSQRTMKPETTKDLIARIQRNGKKDKQEELFETLSRKQEQKTAHAKGIEDSIEKKANELIEEDVSLGTFNHTKDNGLQFNPSTGKLEHTYSTPYGTTTTDKRLADMESYQYRAASDMTVSGQIRQANAKLEQLKNKAEQRRQQIIQGWEDKYQEEYKKAKDEGKALMWHLGNTLGQEQHSYITRANEELLTDQEYRAYQTAIRQTEEQIATLEREGDRQSGKRVGFWRGFGEIAGDLRTWDFGMQDILDAKTMAHAGKESSSESVNQANQELLEATYKNQQAQQSYGQNDNFWYRAGTMTGHMPAFMVDFAITGGGFEGINALSKLATKGATKVIGKEVIEEMAKQGFKSYVKANGVKGFGQYAGNWTIKALGTMADDLIVRAPMMTNTIQGAKTAADIIDRKLGSVIINEDGTYDFSNDKTWSSAIWQGEANSIIENYSEMFGAHLAPVTLKNLSDAAAVFGAKRISNVLAKADAGAIGAIMGRTNEMFTKLGVSDYFGEVTEEYYGQLWRTMLNLDDAYRQNPDGTRTNLLLTGQFHGDILGGMALSMGMMGAGKHSLTAANYAFMKHDVNKADSRARQLFGNDIWEPLRQTIDLTTNDDIGGFIGNVIADTELSDIEKGTILNYIERSLYLRGFNLATLAQSRNAEETDEDFIEQQNNESYMDGYNATGSQEMNDTNNNYLYHREMMAQMFGIDESDIESFLGEDPIATAVRMRQNGASNEEVQTVIDYLNAKATYDGMLQSIRDDIDGQIEQSNALIDSHTNKHTGKIHGAVSKEDGRLVYIVSGNAVPYQDGSGIDLQNSDENIIVRDAETGELKQMSPEFLSSLYDTQDPNEQKEVNAQRIRDGVADQALNKINGVVDFDMVNQIGNTIGITMVLTERGFDKEYIKTFLANAQIVENPDGTLTFTDGQNNVVVPKQEIQQKTDAANMERVAAINEGIKEERAALNENASFDTDYQYDDELSFYGGRIHGTLDRVENGSAIYVDDNKQPVIILAGRNDHQFIGIFREPNSNRWSIKMENKEGDKSIYKRMIASAMSQLPEGSEIYERTSVSLDGLRSFAQQLRYGFEIGNETYETRLNGGDLANIFNFSSEEQEDMAYVLTSVEELPKIKEILRPYLNNLGITDIDNAVSLNDDGTINLKLPVLVKSHTTETTGNTPAETTTATPSSLIPKDESGNPIYEQADSETAWDALIEDAEGDEMMAGEVAKSMIADKEAELKKLEKSKIKDGKTPAEKMTALKERKAEVEKIKQDIEAWKKIAAVPMQRQIAQQERIRQEEAEAAAKRKEAERKEQELLNGIPDYTEDTPQNARTRGYRRVNGHFEQRQQPLQAVQGKETEVEFSNEVRPKGRYAVIDSSQLQPSHIQGNRNPMHFLDEAQPKERNDNASIMSAQKIAGNIRPATITTGETAYVGTPTVNTRGEVIQGNSRSDALRLMWGNHKDQAQIYKQYLIDNAEQFGLNPEDAANMENPVLVRMLDVSDEQAITLGQYVAQDTESGGVERIKPKNAVKKMGSDMRTFASILLDSADENLSFAELLDSNGVKVLKWMNQKGYITDTQYSSAFDSRGNLTGDIKNDLRGIMYQSIFQGGSTRLEEMFNALPAKAQKAILATAHRDFSSPSSESMIKEIQSSIYAFYALMQDEQFAKAKDYKSACKAAEAWQKQYQMDDITGESYLPSEKFSNFALLLAQMYKGKRQSDIQGVFEELYDLIQGTKEDNLFEQADNTPRTLVQAIKETLNIDYNGQRRNNVLVGDNKTSQQGQHGRTEDVASRERTESREQSANDSGRTDEDSGKRRTTETHSVSEEDKIKLSDPRTMSDEEKQRRGDMLRNAPTVEVQKNAITSTPELSARKAAEKWWDDNVHEPVLYNTEAGEVEINRNSIESSLAHRYGQKKLDVITSLVEGFENAVYLGTMPDSRERGVIDHYFAYPIMYNGELNYVFCRAMQDANKNRLYVHEVFLADKIKKGDTLQTAASKPHGGISLYRDILANILDSNSDKDTTISQNNNKLEEKVSENNENNSDAIIDKARLGDKDAIETLNSYGIDWQTSTVYRHVAQSEVDALQRGETINGRFDDGRVDVTSSKDVTTASSSDYRVTFKDTFDFGKNKNVRMKNAELGDGWTERGYTLSDVAKIEKRNDDGTYTTIYDANTSTSLNEQIESAEKEVNTSPTDKQKEAGNYKKGHVQIGTFNITIEQPKGSVRSGVDANGRKWETTMHNTYGYIRGTEGVDGDHIDVFLSDDIDSWNGNNVFVVDQYNEDGTFDEHKVMLGFNTIEEAESAYLDNYEKGWEKKHKIVVSPIHTEEFEKWIASSHRKTKAFAEYKSVQSAEKEDRFSPIQGYSYEEIIETVSDEIKDILNDSGIEGVDVKEVWAHGSRMRGDAKDDSDLDIVMFYEGDAREDGLFNAISESGLVIEGIKIDVNPIRVESQKDIDRYKEKSRQYDEEKMSKNAEKEGVKDPYYVEESLDNGDKRITHYNSRGEISTITTERNGNVISVDSYNEGILFEHTEYDGNGKATSVTRYDKQGKPVSSQQYVDGKIKTNSTETVSVSEKTDSKTIVEQSKKPSSKIEDFGEKIGGARKDVIRKYADKINLNGTTFGAMFPRPEIDKLIEAGLPVNKVAAVKAMFDNAKREFESKKKHYGKDKALQNAAFYAMYAQNVLTGNENNFDLSFNGFVFTEWGKAFMKANIALYQSVFDRLGVEYGKMDLSSYAIHPLTEDKKKKLNLKSLNEQNRKTQEEFAKRKGTEPPVYKDGDLINFVGNQHYNPKDQFETLEEAVDAMVERIANEVKVGEEVKYKAEIYWKLDALGRTDYSKIFVGVKVHGHGTVDLMEFKSSNEAYNWVKEHESDFQQMASAKTEQLKSDKSKPLPKYRIDNRFVRNDNGSIVRYEVFADFGKGITHILKTFEIPAKESNQDRLRAQGEVYKNEVLPYMNSDDAKQSADEHARHIQREKESKNKNYTTERKSRERVGKDWRNGKDATPDMFVDMDGKKSVFGFRAVEFGNYVTNKERQQFLNDIYDALMDMSDVLGVSPRALSLGGQLAIAVGARGKSSASGHYEPEKNVINLTKTSGYGVLAHEWMHAFDRYFSNYDPSAIYVGGVRYATGTEYKDDTRQEVKDAFAALMDVMKKSDYYKRSMMLGEYWASDKELAARALQDHIIRKLNERGQKNDFLSNLTATEDWDGNANDYPFPIGEESERIGEAIDNLFSVIEEKVDEKGNAVMYQKGELVMNAESEAFRRATERAMKQLESIGIEVEIVEDETIVDNTAEKQVIENYNEKFNRELQQQINGTLPKGHIYQLGMASAKLQSAGIPYLPIELAASRLSDKSMQENHPFELSEIEGLVEAVQNPLAVFRSATRIGSFVVLTEIQHEGKNYVAAIQVNRKMGKVEVNTIRSIYPKDGAQIANWIEEGLSEYVDKEKMSEWISKQRSNSADVRNLLRRAAKIIQKFENRAIRSSFSRSAGIFYSNAKKAMLDIKQDKATAQQWIAMLKKNGGLKSGEDAWVGLEEWLNKQEGSVTKQEIIDYIDENSIQIEEVRYSQFGEGLIDEATRKLDAELKEIGWNAMLEKYPGFDELFELFDGELVWSENRASIGEYEDFIIDNKITDLNPSDNAINEIREGYTTTGLKGNREIALTVLGIEPYNIHDKIHFGDAGDGRAVAWIRFGETTDKDGKRVLVIDEIQSKRHQDGREKGYAPKKTVTKEMLRDARAKEFQMRIALEEKYGKPFEAGFPVSERAKARREWMARLPIDEREALENQRALVEEYTSRLDKQADGVPSAPFEKNWQELAMKRMLRYAAENGFDKVAWTTGEQQAERYNLSKTVKKTTVSVRPNNTRMVTLDFRHDEGYMDFVQMRVDENGTIIGGDFIGSQLSDIVGKEFAIKIMGVETERETFTDNDLKIGGEGMKGFYDKIIPSFVSKYTKKWGGQVEETELPETGLSMHSVDVTPQMKEDVMKGQPMFMRTSSGTIYGWTVNGKIYLTKDGINPNTPVHEYAHLWAESMANSNPKRWKRIIEGLKDSPVWNEVLLDSEYKDIHGNDNLMASEVLSRLSGNENYKRTMEDAQRDIESEKDIFAKAEKITIWERVKQALKDFWNWVGLRFTRRPISPEQSTEMVLADFWNGIRPEAENGPIQRMFVGEKGAANIDKAKEATSRLDNLSVARNMETEGKDAKNIKLATGWERGSDGKWRYEMMDDFRFDRSGNVDFEKRNPEYRRYKELVHKNNALAFEGKKLSAEEKSELDKLSAVWKGEKLHNSRRLKDYIDAPELFEAYPELKGVDIRFEVLEEGVQGKYNHKQNTITLNAMLGKEDAASTLNHEIQHAIQHIEGFAKGGSSNDVITRKQEFKSEVRKLHEMMLETPEWAEYVRLVDRWIDNEDASVEARIEAISNSGVLDGIRSEQDRLRRKYGNNTIVGRILNGPYAEDADIWNELPESFNDRFDAYRRLAGEVESRNVQRRMEMSAEERHSSLAQETEDVARKDQVFLYDALENAEEYDVLYRFSDGIDANEISEELGNLSSWSNGSYNLINALENFYKGELISGSSGARHAIKNGLVPVPGNKYSGLNEEYHHLEFRDAEGNTFVESVPFVNAEDVESDWDIRFSMPDNKYTEKQKKYYVEKISGGLWIDNKQEFAKFVSAVENYVFEEDGEGIAYTDNHFYAYYWNVNGEPIPYVDVYLNAEESQDVIKKIQKQNEKRRTHIGIRGYIDRAIVRAGSSNGKDNGYHGNNTSIPHRAGNDKLGGNILRKGRYFDNPSLYVKTQRADRYNRDRVNTVSSSPAPVQRRQMVEHAENLAKRLHLDNIEIVNSVSGLEGKKKSAKGFYDPKTGKITIVIPNNTSIADIEKTLLHEAVAHYGLRQLFGEHFDTFLDNVYNNADESIRKRIAELAIRKYNYDFRKATEEYLASLAESTNFENAQQSSWWQKVKDFFVEMLGKLGFKGTLTDNELRYVLWRSYENLSSKRHKGVFGQAADIAKQYELGVGDYAKSSESDDDVLFRDGDPEIHEKELVRDKYDRRIKAGWYQSKEAFQDSMLSLKEAMKDIAGMEIEDIDGFENAYLGENRLSSVNKAEADAFARLLFKPMLDEVAKLAPTAAERQELVDYMMAKHGLERNEYMRQQAMQNGEDANRDFAGLTSLTGFDDITAAEAEAQIMVNEYEQNHDTTELWDNVNAVSKAILSKSYECGLIDKDTFENISNMYEFYIPLRGFEEKTSDEAYAYLSHIHSAFNAPIKKAQGRSSKADDPFAYLQSMAESAIMQGNRNKLVKQRFLNFVLNHPSDLISISELWLEYDNVDDEWRPVFPDNIDTNDSGEVVEQKMKDFDEKMELLSQNEPDRYKKGRDAIGIPYRVVKKKDLQQHQVIVKRNGRDVVLTVNGNPRLAQALNGQTNPDNDMSGAIGAVLRSGEWVNRQLSAFYTTRNPDFIVSNFLRDMLYSNSMAWFKESPNYALRFNRNYMIANPITMKRLLNKYRKGTLDTSDKIEGMFYQFMMNGGETGYTNIRDIEQHKNDIRKELRRSNGRLKIGRALSLLAERFDELNRAIENCARFAAFMTSKEMGRTTDRAIYDAKEISVNFNKKGSGSKFYGEVGQTVAGNASALASGLGRSGFVFWNAAIQGTTNFGRQIKRHPAKAFTGIASMFLLGALVAFLGGDDDDDDNKNSYYNLPEYVRRSNILFRAGEHWISIPLPVEYRAIYGLGELMISAISGKEHLTDSEIAEAIIGQMSQVLPLDFMEGGGGLNALVPSAVKPVIEAYVIEKSWTGMPLYKDTPYNKNKPEWTKAYSSANKHIVNLTASLNEATGGDRYTKGWLDQHPLGIDLINPAKIEYVLKGYFGGVFNTIDKMTKMAETATGEREYDPQNFLLLNRVVKAGDERTEYRAVNNEYQRLKKEYEILDQRLKNYEKDTYNGVFDYAEKIDFIYNSPEFQRHEIFEIYKKDIKFAEEWVKQAESVHDDEGVKEAEHYLNELKKEMIEEMNKTRKRA